MVWAGTATRTAKNLGVAPRADVQAIVDAANAETAPLRNQVIGTQNGDILRDPTRLSESAMGNLVADAMRCKYPASTWAALTNSGGLRADILATPPSARRGGPARSRGARCSRCCRSATATAIETITGAQLTAALLNGFSPACNPAIATGRFPQVSGLKVDVPLQRHDAGGGRRSGARRTGPAGRSPRSARPTPSASSPTTSCSRGGDGYTALGRRHRRAAARRPCSTSRSSTSSANSPVVAPSRAARRGRTPDRHGRSSRRGGAAGPRVWKTAA